MDSPSLKELELKTKKLQIELELKENKVNNI
jgi:hypothetical protein